MLISNSVKSPRGENRLDLYKDEAVSEAISQLLQYFVQTAPDLCQESRLCPTAERKSDGTSVTKWDRAVEQSVKSIIAKALPSATFLGEESAPLSREGTNSIFDGRYLVVCDPIDGTQNFQYGIPLWGTSIGIFVGKNGELRPCGGIVTFPASGECFYSKLDNVVSRCLYDGKEENVVPVSQDVTSRAVILLTQSFYRHFEASSLSWHSELPSPRTLGSTVADIMYAALGRAVGTLTRASIWDVAGAMALANLLGRSFWNLTTNEPLRGFRESDFFLDGSQRHWQLKSCYLVATEECALKLRPLINYSEIDFERLNSR